MTREEFIRKWLGNPEKQYTEQFRDKMREDLDKVTDRVLSLGADSKSVCKHKEVIWVASAYKCKGCNEIFEAI